MGDINSALRAQLLTNRNLARDQLNRAETHARKENISLEKALVSLGLVESPALGTCLSQIHQLPYKPLLNSPPSAQSRNALSPQCASRWKVFPADYDADQHVLTLAINDPAQIPKMEHIQHFFMQPHTVAFVIASEFEIEKAIEMHLAPKPADSAASQKTEEKAKEQAKSDEPRKALKLSALGSAGTKSFLNLPDQAKAQEPTTATRRDQLDLQFSREEVSRALISAAALLVSAYHESKTDKLAEVRERVRYCQLLASRLGLQPMELDKVVLAAWLSGLEEQPYVLKQFVTPYDIEKVLNPSDRPGTESLILSLVKIYQSLNKNDSSLCKDVNLTRRNLQLAWSCPLEQQGMLETFLQLLMDEQFLAKASRATGCILVIDPTELSTPSMTPPLINRGYEVHVAPTAESAAVIISCTVPDLIIAEVELPKEGGFKFFQTIRSAPAAAKIPFMVVMSQKMEKMAAEFLRAGADDYLLKPINLELLFLKVEKLVTTQQNALAKSGVKGSLEDMNFTDMIQILCAGNKSLEIVLTHESQEGHVFVSNGDIVHAVFGDKQGEEAFYKLMLWRKGDFTARQCAEFPARTIQVPTMSLLMEGARLADEGTMTQA
jgi:response regulator RpfG family c-di-GMP phosphodiesterase